MRDTRTVSGSAIGLPAAVVAVMIGLLAVVADPATAAQTPAQSASVHPPGPGIGVCVHAAVGSIVLGAAVTIGSGVCAPGAPPAAAPVNPAPPAAAPPPAVVVPAPVAVPPAQSAASPGPAVPAVPKPRPTPKHRPVAAPPRVPSVRDPRAAAPWSGRPPSVPVAPMTEDHYRPKAEQAAAHVLPPHQNPLRNVMVVVVLALIVAVFAGGLFAGLR